jgi:hypothetical protein
MGTETDSSPNEGRGTGIRTTSRREAVRSGVALGTTLLAGCSDIIGGGSGGSLTVNLEPLVIGEQVPWDEFETLTVRFERCVLHPTSGDPVTVNPAERNVDLTALNRGEVTALVDAASVPSGEYRSADFHLPVANATLADGSTATFAGGDPLSMSTGALGQWLTVDSGETVVLLSVGPSRTDEGRWELGAGIRIPPG